MPKFNETNAGTKNQSFTVHVYVLICKNLLQNSMTLSVVHIHVFDIHFFPVFLYKSLKNSSPNPFIMPKFDGTNRGTKNQGFTVYIKNKHTNPYKCYKIE